MPNGGSDCCGTCWFNSDNKSKAEYNQSLMIQVFSWMGEIQQSQPLILPKSFCSSDNLQK